MNAHFLQNAFSNHSHPSGESHSDVRVAFNPAGHAIHLDDHQQLSLRDAVGWTVKPLAGSVWITLNEDSRDIVLDAGESFVVDRPGDTLVSALGEARVCITNKVLRSVKGSPSLQVCGGRALSDASALAA